MCGFESRCPLLGAGADTSALTARESDSHNKGAESLNCVDVHGLPLIAFNVSPRIHSSNPYDTKRSYSICHDMLRFFCSFFLECGHSSGWHNAQRKHC